MKVLNACVLMLVVSQAAQSQVATSKPSVRATGDATITSTPDQAKVSFAVETRAATAQDAAAQNATITSAAIAALQNVLGSAGTVQTTGYSLTALYSTMSGGQTAVTGFSASNSVQATINSLSLIGKAIDAGVQAGATSVQSLVFGLQNLDPVLVQALKQATALARTHADAMAGGAGLHLGNVISVVEGTNTVPVYLAGGFAAAAPTTPIQPGNVTTTATVTVEYELVQ